MLGCISVHGNEASIQWVVACENENAEAVQRLVEDIRRRKSLDVALTWPSPPLNVIDCVVSLRRNYERMVLPRVRRFAQRRPEITTLRRLQGLIRNYDAPYDFGVAELDYRDKGRMLLLLAVTERLMDLTSDDSGLARWAESVGRGGEVDFGARGFGPAGFQYMRILFGAQTFKPDVHILAHVAEITGLHCEQNEALALLEQAVAQTGAVARDLDFTIWRERSGALFAAL